MLKDSGFRADSADSKIPVETGLITAWPGTSGAGSLSRTKELSDNSAQIELYLDKYKKYLKNVLTIMKRYYIIQS